MSELECACVLLFRFIYKYAPYIVCVKCVVAPVIMERKQTPILLLGSNNLAYAYPVVSYYEKCYCVLQLLCCICCGV